MFRLDLLCILVKVDAELILRGWKEDKRKSILKFREQNYKSLYTGKKGKTDQTWVKHNNINENGKPKIHGDNESGIPNSRKENLGVKL